MIYSFAQMIKMTLPLKKYFCVILVLSSFLAFLLVGKESMIFTGHVVKSMHAQSSSPIHMTSQPHLHVSEKIHLKDTTDTAILAATTVVTADNKKFLVNSPSCKIPWIDPFHESIVDYLLPVPDIRCEKWDPEVLTFRRGNNIYVNNTALVISGYNNTFLGCFYSPLYKRNGSSNWDPAIRKKGKMFRDFVTIHNEQHVEVACFNTSKDVIYWNYYVFPYLKKTIIKEREERLQQRKKRSEGTETLNIMLLAVDSMSKQNFVRFMPRTIDYLSRDLGAIELQGYSKVAKNTLVNLLPILTGRHKEELVGQVEYPVWDELSYIWQNFSREGYLTMYGEDDIAINSFDYMDYGFRESPTDFYLRDFLLSFDDRDRDNRGIWHDGFCIHNRLEFAVAMDITKTFLGVAPHLPKFSFLFTAGLTHDYIQNGAIADHLVVDYLRSLHADGYFDHTVFFFFSDHGMRFGDFRQTFVGRVEDSLPAMFVRVPPWFVKKYPSSVENLRKNVHKLTTPFDFHATLQHLLQFTGQEPKVSKPQRGYSFFANIPDDRTCANAGILQKYCVCNVGHPTYTKQQSVQTAALTLVDAINENVKGMSSKCHYLELSAIQSVTEEKVTRDTLMSFHRIFQFVNFKKLLPHVKVFTVVLQTVPGNGVYEGNVLALRVGGSTRMMAAKQITRINKYAGQTDCIHGDNGKRFKEMFCYCKSLNNTTV